ncbi:DegQ family serine endoprotease [Halomonas stenophila]|uniref:Probable periplasmic serine endoprotease DegP-like n=1 Tax=Halomonas stenophila TaxID=795312 RepID=A0A7W5ESZ5_9GAMM|nr:DegQ family serine endoprotease [Halomonas stenophila]MBB3230879.1 serine protease Do [Halomonas stenophila]
MHKPHSLSWVTSLVLLLMVATPALAEPRLPDFTELVDKAAPAVVNISTSREVERSMTSSRQFGGQEVPDIFRHFFGDRFPMPPGGGPNRGDEQRQSLGSGFIFDEDGYIMTNAHVVKDADEILVRLNDRRELEAELVGADEKTDVAVLKVEANNLPTLELGKSTDLKVGQWVAAIGSPFGFDHSVTSGIISAINRTLPQDVYVPFIQTDVAINPGNSGGPLFNLDGEVVGINSQILTRSGGYMGLSFAIPIDVAMDVANQLREEGYVSRGWLGVSIQPVSEDLAESFGMEQAKGALIAELDSSGPAAKGGLKAGDVILEVNGQQVDHSTTLPRLVGDTAPGEEVELSVLRDGQRETITVEVGEWPNAGPGQADGDPVRLGIAVQPLNEMEKRRLGIEHGVRIVKVDPTGHAAAAGILPGDVLVRLGNQPVEGPEQLKGMLANLPDDQAVPVLLNRDGQAYFVAFRLGNDG